MTCSVSGGFSTEKSQTHLPTSLTQTAYPIRTLAPFLEAWLTRKCSRVCLKKTPTLLPRDQLVVKPVSNYLPVLCSMLTSASIAPMLLSPTSLKVRLVLSTLLPKTRVEVWTTLSSTCPLLSAADLPSRTLPPPFSLHFVSSYSKYLSSIDERPCRSTNILTVSFCLSIINNIYLWVISS